MATTLVDRRQNQALVDPLTGSLRVAIKPLDYSDPATGTLLGHYGVTAISGVIAASLAAASQLLAVRWADPTRLCVLTRVSAALGIATAAQTLGNPLDLEMVLVRNYTVNSTGGAIVQPAPTGARTRSTMAPSLFGNVAPLSEIRVITTAALTPGTGLLDTTGVGYGMYPGNALGVVGNVDLYKYDKFAQHPIVLGLNEGFIIRTPTGFGAAATFKAGFTLEWAEVAAL